MVGLGNVENTTDLNKPISTATQTALNLKYDASNPSGYTTNVGTVTSVGGTGTVSGLSLSGTVTTNGNLTLGGTLSLTSGNVTTALGYTPENASNKGVANGYASLDGGGLVPSTQLPSYVDDVLEFANLAAFPASGATGKIYVALDTNKIYRWSGATYIEVSPTVGTIWGGITGTLSNQTDLQNALNAKQDDITLTTTGTSGAATFISNTLNIPNYAPDLSGYVPYTGATTNVNLGTHSLTAANLVINHVSGSGVAASITKGGNGEALTVVKTSGSGNAASITGGVTLLDELHLNTDLADAYIASATNWNTAYTNRITSLTTTGTSGAATLTGNTLNIPQYQGALTNPVTGTGTTNTVPKFIGASAIGNSNITDSGTNIILNSDTTINGFVSGTITKVLSGATVNTRTFNITSSANSSLSFRDIYNFNDDAFTTTFAQINDIRIVVNKSNSFSDSIRYINAGVTNNGTASQNSVLIQANSAGTGNFGLFTAYKVGQNSPNNNTNSYTNYFGLDISNTPVNNVTNYYGITIANFTGTSLSRALDLNLAAGTNKFNIFAGGTANNYMAGSLGIGSVGLTAGFSGNLLIGKAITGNSNSRGVLLSATIQSDVSNATGYLSTLSLQAASFTCNELIHFRVSQGTYGAGSSVNDQYGFYVDSNFTGANFKNIAFYGNIAAAAGQKFNLYMAGTANNYLAGSLQIGSQTDAGFKLDVTGTARVSGNATFSSNVGIGTASPSQLLEVNNGTQSIIKNVSGTRTLQLESYAADWNYLASTGNNLGINVGGANALVINVNSAERMRITSAGNVGIGTNSPKSYGVLTVNGQTIGLSNISVDINQAFKFNNYYSSSAGADKTISTGFAGGLGFDNSVGALTFSNSSSSVAADGNITTTERMRIFASGNVRFSSQVYGNTVASPRTLFIASDGELGGISSIRESKTNINAINSNWLMQLNPVSFNYRKKDNDGIYTNEYFDELFYGLIAEETELINKEICTYTDGKLVGIEYSKLVPVLVKAIQELSAEITILKNK
jgi:hypothetical protein